MKQKTLYNYWNGQYSGDKFEGFGEITFFDSAQDKYQNGKDEFYDNNLSDVKSITMKRSVLRRCTDEEADRIKKNIDGQHIGSPVREELIKSGIV